MALTLTDRSEKLHSETLYYVDCFHFQYPGWDAISLRKNKLAKFKVRRWWNLSDTRFKLSVEKESTKVVLFVSLMLCYTEKTRTLPYFLNIVEVIPLFSNFWWKRKGLKISNTIRYSLQLLVPFCRTKMVTIRSRRFSNKISISYNQNAVNTLILSMTASSAFNGYEVCSYLTEAAAS